MSDSSSSELRDDAGAKRSTVDAEKDSGRQKRLVVECGDRDTIRIKVPNSSYVPEGQGHNQPSSVSGLYPHPPSGLVAGGWLGPPPPMMFPPGMYGRPGFWSMNHVEEIYETRGYRAEIAFLQQAEYETQFEKAKNVDLIQAFSLKMVIRMLETIKQLRKFAVQKSRLSGEANTDNWSKNSFDLESDHSESSASGGGQKGGGRGGPAYCFKCKGIGHITRDCPTGGDESACFTSRGANRGGENSRGSSSSGAIKRPRTSSSWEKFNESPEKQTFGYNFLEEIERNKAKRAMRASSTATEDLEVANSMKNNRIPKLKKELSETPKAEDKPPAENDETDDWE